MTKKEAVERLGIADKTFDYALPQPWVDDVTKRLSTKIHIAGLFVWLYDGWSLAGRPFALHDVGWILLDRYNRLTGCHWPLY